MLVLDNDTQLCAKSFKKFHDDLHIRKKFASVKHLQTNGLVDKLETIKKKSVKWLLTWMEDLDNSKFKVECKL